MTIPMKKRIDLKPIGYGREAVLHELLHAYLAEICILSTDLDSDNIEEVFCELFAKRGREILDLGDKLTAKVQHIATTISEPKKRRRMA